MLEESVGASAEKGTSSLVAAGRAMDSSALSMISSSVSTGPSSSSSPSSVAREKGEEEPGPEEEEMAPAPGEEEGTISKGTKGASTLLAEEDGTSCSSSSSSSPSSPLDTPISSREASSLVGRVEAAARAPVMRARVAAVLARSQARMLQSARNTSTQSSTSQFLARVARIVPCTHLPAPVSLAE